MDLPTMTALVKRLKEHPNPLHFLAKEGPFTIQSDLAHFNKCIQNAGGLLGTAKVTECPGDEFGVTAWYAGNFDLGPFRDGTWMRFWLSVDQWGQDGGVYVRFFKLDYDPTECQYAGECSCSGDYDDYDECLSCEYGSDWCLAHYQNH